MVFARYFFKRYAYYASAIAIAITTLLMLIEVVEKLMRVSHANLSEIVLFLGLYSLPVFFDNCSLAGWLSAGLLLREFIVHHEWELMMMLNINGDKLIRLFCFAGFILMLGVVVSKEFFVSSLAFKAEQFKLVRFKHGIPRLIFDRWIQLQERQFCFMGVWDSETGKGSDMTVLSLLPDFSLERIVWAETFSINAEMNTIIVEIGSVFDAKNQTVRSCVDECISAPPLNPQLCFDVQAPTLWAYCFAFFKARSRLPENVHNKLLGLLFKKIFSYIQIFLYPFLSAVFFAMAWSRKWLRWGVLLIAYPLFLLLDAFFDVVIAGGMTAWIIPFVYVFLFILIIFLKKKFAR